MGLSNDLISQFVKATKDDKKTTNESTVYGTIKVADDGSKSIVLDGDKREQHPIPLSNEQLAVTVTNGDRVRATIKNHNLVVTGNIHDPSASSKDVSDANARIDDFDAVVADKVSTDELYAERARIDALIAEDIVIKDRLSANEADIVTLEADNVTINNTLKANTAGISNLKADKLDANTAKITYATIEDLDAAEADIYNLRSTYGEFVNLTTENFKAVDADIEYLKSNKVDAADADIIKADIADLNAEVANIDTLIFGSATGDTIQTSFSNSVIAQLGDAQIKSAMIESVSAGKITSGDIITNNVRVKSEDGSLLISDETMQISDSTRVRVQIGKDAAGDYSINIWDQNGNLMFSKGGITDSAIKDAIIRNDMVSDTANIAAHKLDIDSLFEEINGSSNTIKSTQVYIDDKKQTLNVAFKAITEDVDGLESTVSSQGTQISAIQGQISSKIWQQDINSAVSDIEVGGRNLYIVKNSIEGYLSSNGDGTIMEASPMTKERTSDYIPVTVGDDMRFQLWVTTPETSYIWYAYQFYKEDKTALDNNRPALHLYETTNGYYHVTYDPIVVPEGAAYIRVSARMFDDGKIKVERGNTPTDWTPAPEDTESDITSLSTRYSSMEQTINGISATVASHESAIAKKADSSTVTTVNDKVTSLEQNLNGFKTTVSNTYSTKTELANVSDKADSVASRMSSAETSISQHSTSIGLCATKTEVENALKNYSTTSQMNAAIQLSASGIESTVSSKYATKETVDGIEIGGRNLYIVKNSQEGFLTTGTNTLGGMDPIRKEHTSEFIPVKVGDNYIFQVWTTVNPADTNDPNLWMAYEMYNSDKVIITNRPAKRSTNTLPNGQCYDIFEITVPTNAVYIRVSARLYSDGRIKLEKGTKPTGWSPAPEDTESGISALDIRMTTVEQTADGLTVRMSAAETGISNAAKTATNYINASTSGLVVGDMTASTLGKNVRITSSTVDIREGSTTLASFGASTIYLGKNSETAVINLCNGSATMKSVDDSNFQIYTDKRLVMKAYDSLLLDCWRDSTHQTRISMQSADPDATYMYGGISAWVYQDTVKNTFDMSKNTVQFDITDGTNETIVSMDETKFRVQANNAQINCTNGLYVGYDGSYAAKVTLGYKYLQDKSVRWYWSDNAIHDAFSNSNGQITYVGPGDIGETTTTMVRGQYVRLYAHNGGAVYLGYSGSTAVTSDRNMKTDILDLDDKYMDFFDRLRPITYKYNAPGNKGHRDHVGFIAQEVEEALVMSGLTTEEFAGLIIEKDVTLSPNHDSSMTDDERQADETHYDTLYSLRYEEFISLLVKKVQSLQEQINQLRAV